MTIWNEAMYFFHLAPKEYRKIFLIKRDYNKKRNKTLGEYYIEKFEHLIPDDVEIWELDLIKEEQKIHKLK